jgi:hypothetical protein
LLADFYFLDGIAVADATSFGEFSATTGVWVPKAYTGTYGTNGFRLTFADNSAATATTLGKDAAGSNNWTPNNLSVTAGAGNDSLIDVPVNGSEVDSGLGGQVRGNYAVLNPLLGSGTKSDGNLTTTTPNAYSPDVSTIAPSSGKWYFEVTWVSGQYARIGVQNVTRQSSDFGSDAYGWRYESNTGNVSSGGSTLATGNTYTPGDIIGVAYDCDACKMWVAKNGTWQNSGNPATGANASATNLPVGTPLAAGMATGTNTSVFTANFGQRPFAYTAPSGFKALCTANLPAPTIVNPSTVMDVKLYTGNGSTQTISGLGFSPDLVWIKRRSVNSDHNLFDAVRGATQTIKSNNTDAEVTASTSLTAFNSDGFSVGSNSDVNGNTHPVVAWAWDAGTSNATNTNGTITSTVRANISAGFSVCTFTSATGTSNFSVGHGLGVSPEFVIVKSRDSAGVWYVYHKSLATDYYLRLNATNAAATDGVQWGAGMTSSVIGLRAGYSTVPGAATVAYAWTSIPGMSAFGSYTGNGSATDGPFVWCGFRPRWLMIKCASGSAEGNWVIYDALRGSYNLNSKKLAANGSFEENNTSQLGDDTIGIDFLSNGFKIRVTGNNHNISSGTYVWAAFAESPFAANNRAR